MHPGRHGHPGFILRVLALLLLAAGSLSARQFALVKRTDFTACADLIQTSSHPLTVIAPSLNYTIASFDPNWFNTDASQQGAPLFTVLTSPLLRGTGPLTLRVYVWADTAVGSDTGRIVLFDRVTQALDSGDVGVYLTSNQIFALPFQSGGVSFNQNNPLYNLIAQQRQVPPMDLHIGLFLFCGGVPVTESGVNVSFQSTTLLRYVHTLQALSPGTDVANSKPVPIYTLSPLFQIVSDLFNSQDFQYPPDEPKMEIFLYEVHEGQSAPDVLNGTEFAKFPVPDQFPVTYPPGLPLFVPGHVYAWRVRALLRGPESEYRFSNALYFQVDSRLGGGSDQSSTTILSEREAIANQVLYSDDYVKRVLAALKIILGENFGMLDLSRTEKIPAKGHIRLNGRPYSLEELERLASEFQQSRHSVTRVRFQ